MSLEGLVEELQAERWRLRAANEELRLLKGALEAQVDAMGEAMLEMAARLDRYERPEPEPAPEIREWFGTAQWSGPAAAYNANSSAINHELALQIQQMAINAESARIHPQQAEIGGNET